MTHQYLPHSFSCAAAFSAISLLKPYSVPKSTATGLLSAGASSDCVACSSVAASTATSSYPVSSFLSAALHHSSQQGSCLQDDLICNQVLVGSLALVRPQDQGLQGSFHEDQGQLSMKGENPSVVGSMASKQDV